MEDLYVISRCLLGVNCKYDGGNNCSPDVIQFTKKHRCIDVCPETAGGLSAPRPPAEQIPCSCPDGKELTDKNGMAFKVVDRMGRDVTAEFACGAERSFAEVQRFAEANGCRIAGAILKAKSPSCGAGEVYDGSFSGVTVPGDGVFAAMLLAEGIPVANENDYKEILND